MQNAIPESGATITQVNPALEYFFLDGAPNITEDNGVYTKSQFYDGSDRNYQLVLKPGTVATVTIGSTVYTINATFTVA